MDGILGNLTEMGDLGVSLLQQTSISRRFICCNYYVFFLKEQGQLFREGRARFTPVVGRLPHPKTTNLRLLQTTFLSLLSVWLSRKVWARRFTVHVFFSNAVATFSQLASFFWISFLFGVSFLDWTGLPSMDTEATALSNSFPPLPLLFFAPSCCSRLVGLAFWRKVA